MKLRYAFLIAMFGGLLFAQPPATPARPKIGLVLSGGSALGLSHVGVLRWLEEHRIPVTYVAGTSMGGLVGGLYATGHDSPEITEFVKTIDWSQAFSTAPPFHDVAFRRKEDRREFPNKLELGLNGGVQFPGGVSSGHEVGLVISRFAAPYADFGSFDDLPTPFRCVATDLITGEQVVFSKGSLPTALRATMSLPAIFSPVQAGNTTMADGGMLNNLPVDVAKAMGADLIVAVALVDPEAKQDSVASMFGVGKRSIAIMIDANERRSMALADLLIAPDLPGIHSTDFEKYEELERRGYEAAEKMAASLTPLSVSAEEYQRYLAERKRKRLPEQIDPAFITVEGVDGAQRDVIEVQLRRDLEGRPTTSQRTEDSLDEVLAGGAIQSAAYGFVSRNGAEGMRVIVQKKSYGPPILNTGFTIDGSDTGNIRFGLGARLTFLNFGGPNSDWRSDFTVGLNNSIASEYYKRFGGTRWFVAPRGYFGQRQEDVYTGNIRTSIFKVRESDLGSDFGFAASRFQELRLGYQYSHINPLLSTGEIIPQLTDSAASLHSVRFRWSYDGQDSGVVPRYGFRSTADLRWNFIPPSGMAPFGVFEQKMVLPKSFGRRYILLSQLAGGTILGPKAYILPFSLGGPGFMSAFGRGQMRGDRYYYGSVQALRAFSANRNTFLGKTYLDLGAELGKAFSDIELGKPAYDAFAAVVSETPVGVAFVGYSYGTSGNQRLIFRIGRLF